MDSFVSFDIDTKGSLLYHRLRVSPLKRIFSDYCTPTSLNFSNGRPLASVFPLHSLRCTLSENSALSSDSSSSSSFEVVNDVTLQQNYTRGSGIDSLHAWIQQHMEALHPSPREYAVCMSIGASDSVIKVFQLLKGDSILIDKLAYTTTLEVCQAINKITVGVESDEQGMITSSLREQTLLAREKGLSPDAVYLVPVAQNPTGITMSIARKHEIYQTCQELDLVIIEDGSRSYVLYSIFLRKDFYSVNYVCTDAYYYLYFGEEDTEGDYSLDSLPGIRQLPK